MVNGINKVKGFSCNYPNGTFYCFVNIKKTNFTSIEIQKILLEELGIATLDGNNFGIDNNNYLRISCCTNKENIELALKKIKERFN